MFHELHSVLAGRGYPNTKIEGIYYWLWEIGKNLSLYSNQGKFGSNKLFIDAKIGDLAKILSAIKGVIPPENGATKNQKFKTFGARTKNFVTGQLEHEGLRFEFEDAASANKFLNVCEEFANKGLAAAAEMAFLYEQVATKTTSRQTIVSTRVGQNKFREKVIKYWNTCAITGCNVTSILKSSHIKPWACSDSLEKLDAFNGILLTPNLDSLFDLGLIAFTDEGRILLATELSTEACQSLGITSEMQLRKINTAHIPYLNYHRERLFRDKRLGENITGEY